MFQALWSLGKTAVKTWFLGAIGALALAASWLGVNELIVLLVAGIAVAIRRGISLRGSGKVASWFPLPL